MRRMSIVFLLVFSFFTFALNLPKVKMNPLQREIIDTALSMVGGKYSWGAYDPKNRTFDCWNFVTWVFHHVLDKDGGVKHMLIGIDDPLWVFFKDIKDLRPGDVLMNGGGHTVGFHSGIYYGEGYTIEARGGRYGIGVFRIEGLNPHCPFGQTGYRFCYYSLLARLWLDPKPDSPYVYLKLPQTFFLSDEGVILELHAYSPKRQKVKVVLEVFEYLGGDLVKRVVLDDFEVGPEERKDVIHLNLGNFSGYVYFSVVMLNDEGKLLFHYDTYIKGHTEIM